ncbi:MAG: exopolyphosphatase/pppGpp-phosphohydrolase [Ilumatobacter sp.]|jgi:exopolyphosphatase/pppGpp-phosphohydrolase
MDMTSVSLLIAIGDREMTIEMIGGGTWTIPVGPVSLVEGELERSNRPAPEQLTNALGIVIDHLDDVVRDSPEMLNAPDVTFTGRHAVSFGRVELGDDALPADYIVERRDADEVFRTLVAEPREERIHNPGLDPDDIETIIGVSCVVLAVMRRLELTQASIATVVA